VTALEDRLAGYLAVRRALGYRLARAEKLLAQFIAWMNERGEPTITTASALAWATLPEATAPTGTPTGCRWCAASRRTYTRWTGP
jgi:hypothetical protein